MNALYDKIGLNYANLRRPDARIAKIIKESLGEAESVLNVGAGAGSYEPEGKKITALEPSLEMISQRKDSSAELVQGVAENLPFEDNSFDACMAVLTVHHWKDQPLGMSEMRRVSRGNVVILTYDPDFIGFWLIDYFPKLATLDQGQMPKMANYGKWFDNFRTEVVPIPHDCTDGFLAAYWRRPEAYLDERVRAAMSSFWAIGEISAELEKLESDLRTGLWKENNHHLLDLKELDCGYRLVVAN